MNKLDTLLADILDLLLLEEVVNVLLFEIQEHLGNCFKIEVEVDNNKFVDLIEDKVNLDELAIDDDNLGIDMVKRKEEERCL